MILKKNLIIEGMTCGHCAGHTKTALESISGVKSAEVDLSTKTATVELTHDVEDEKFNAVIDEIGYKVISIS